MSIFSIVSTRHREGTQGSNIDINSIYSNIMSLQAPQHNQLINTAISFFTDFVLDLVFKDEADYPIGSGHSTHASLRHLIIISPNSKKLSDWKETDLSVYAC